MTEYQGPVFQPRKSQRAGRSFEKSRSHSGFTYRQFQKTSPQDLEQTPFKRGRHEFQVPVKPDLSEPGSRQVYHVAFDEKTQAINTEQTTLSHRSTDQPTPPTVYEPAVGEGHRLTREQSQQLTESQPLSKDMDNAIRQLAMRMTKTTDDYLLFER